MNKKALSKKYYFGIVKLLIIYVLAAIACFIFKGLYDGAELSLKKLFLGTFDFTNANYSWYIEMYIGLFMLIPFLNLIYNNLKNKKQKQILVITFIALTTLPTVFNIYNFDSLEWWVHPSISKEFSKLIPSWWMGIYPLTYYFTGCYLKEFGVKFKTHTLLPAFVIAAILFGSLNYFRCFGVNFTTSINVFWYGFEPYILSVLLFSLLLRINTQNFAKNLKLILWKLSDLVMGMFLLSFIFDKIIYTILNKNVSEVTQRFPYFFITVTFVFICSACGAFVLDLVEKGIMFVYKQTVKLVKSKKQKSKQ